MMITNGRDQLVNAPGLLQMQSALLGWFYQIKAIVLKKALQNFQIVETETPYEFQGVLQPMKPRVLQMKAAGQRAWRWWTIHAEIGLQFEDDDIIWIGDVKFRVMEKFDWSAYGYVEYHLVQDYQDRKTSPPIPSNTLQKFSSSVTYSGTPVSVDVSASIDNATNAIWRLYDSDHNPVLAAITVVDASHVLVSVSPPSRTGTYTLIGEG